MRRVGVVIAGAISLIALTAPGAASVAITVNLCLPSSRRLTLRGELQGVNGFLLILHSKVASGSSELNSDPSAAKDKFKVVD